MRESFESLLSQAVSKAETSEGWDFSFLDERRRTDDVPWSFEDIVLSAAESASSMLDMDTGGGERLLALAKNADRWPTRVVATESFDANLVVARQCLSPAGIEVIPYASPDGLPFGDGEFPLIVNRHGRYSPHEVQRVLQPGGMFITEQVGSDMCTELNRLLKAPNDESVRWDVGVACEEIAEAGLTVVRKQEHHGRDVFVDIGAVVWYLLKVPWQIPHFTVEEYAERLRALHEVIKDHGPIDVGSHHFLVVAQEPHRVSRTSHSVSKQAAAGMDDAPVTR